MPAPAFEPRADLDIIDAVVFDGHDVLDADRVSIRDGEVVAIGQLAPPTVATRTISAGGGLLTPGFVDAHVHTAFGGIESLACDLSGADGLEETLGLIRAHLSATAEPGAGAAGEAGAGAAGEAGAEGAGPAAEAGAGGTGPAGEAGAGSAGPANWLTGGGWAMADFPGGAPTADILDELSRDRPIILLSADHHSAWVNTKAMEVAGLHAATPTPTGGVIEKDAAGQPAGCLHESAMEIVSSHVPSAADAEIHAGLLAGQAHLGAFGITAWMDALVGEYGGHRSPFDSYVRAADSGELTAEVVGSLWWPREVTDIDAQVTALSALRRDTGGFRTTSVKFMLDGIVESRTAAMSTEYVCPCGGFGTSYFSRDHLHRAFAALDAAGFDIHCHAIGDAAVADALDAFAALGSGRRADARHHIAHVQVVDPADVPRFAELGVSANLQALWACHDEQMIDLNIPSLGAQRTSWQYPFRGFADSGAHLAMGSDWPVSTPNPWEAIHVAVNRSHPRSQDPAPLVPEQAIDVTTALRAYTAGSAHLLRSEVNGRIRLGGIANLALADANPFALDPGGLSGIGNRLTLAGGVIVHDTTAEDHTP